MKILLCLNQDLYSNFALNHLQNFLKKHQIYLTFSKSVGISVKHLEILNLLEQGIVNQVIFPLLEQQSKYESTESEVGKETIRAKAKRYLTFKQLSDLYHWPILEIENINSRLGIAELHSLEPDLILSIRYGKIFQSEAISIPKYGIMNLHSGKLPDYKGVMATFRAMLAEDDNLGISLHYISNKNIDTGEVIDIGYSPLDQNKSFFGNLLSLYEIGCEMTIKYLTQLAEGKEVKATPQKSFGAYYSYPTSDELQKFQEKFSLINQEDYLFLLKKYSSFDLGEK